MLNMIMNISVRIARVAHFCYCHKILWGGGFFKFLNRMCFSCDIAYQVDIHSSCRFPHQGLGVVIHPAVKMGKNCIIYQNVTLGANGKRGYGNEAPIVGDNVMIGAGAVILGGIKIGDNAIVAANAVVLNDVPQNVMVAGVPAKIKNKSL